MTPFDLIESLAKAGVSTFAAALRELLVAAGDSRD
jgi:hypothetical protein